MQKNVQKLCGLQKLSTYSEINPILTTKTIFFSTYITLPTKMDKKLNYKVII
jgi:hypothetical protein